MSLAFKQNEKCYKFDCLPKGESILQFVFRNETNQPLCDLLISISKKKYDMKDFEPELVRITSNDSEHKSHEKKPFCECDDCKEERKKKRRHQSAKPSHPYDCECDPCKKKKKREDKEKEDDHHSGHHKPDCGCDHPDHGPCKKKPHDRSKKNHHDYSNDHHHSGHHKPDCECDHHHDDHCQKKHHDHCTHHHHSGHHKPDCGCHHHHDNHCKMKHHDHCTHHHHSGHHKLDCGCHHHHDDHGMKKHHDHCTHYHHHSGHHKPDCGCHHHHDDHCKKKHHDHCTHHHHSGHHKPDCGCHHHHDNHCKMKHHDCDRPHGTSIAMVKIQTTSFADVLEWFSPSKKVCIEFEELFNGKCIPTHAPNNVLIVTLILTRPIRGDEVITFEPGSGFWPVLINESHCSDDQY